MVQISAYSLVRNAPTEQKVTALPKTPIILFRESRPTRGGPENVDILKVTYLN